MLVLLCIRSWLGSLGRGEEPESLGSIETRAQTETWSCLPDSVLVFSDCTQGVSRGSSKGHVLSLPAILLTCLLVLFSQLSHAGHPQDTQSLQVGKGQGSSKTCKRSCPCQN